MADECYPSPPDTGDILNEENDPRVLTSGNNCMQGQFKAASGSQTAPGLSFCSATSTGFWLDSLGNVCLSIQGMLALYCFQEEGLVIQLGGKNATLTHSNTSNHTYALPDKSGTIALLDDADTGGFIFSSAAAPSSASDTGTTGEVRRDSSYLYVCTAPDTWKRIAMSSW